MQNKLQQLKKQILKELGEINNSESLRCLEIKYFSRKGKLAEILRGIVGLGKEDKAVIGKMANEIKNELNKKLKEVKSIIEGKSGQGGFIDVSLPGEKIERGHLHPITIIQNELEDLFVSMGFMVLDGPELESEYYNFEALNIPKHHPARDMQDTFYVENPKSKIQNFDDKLVMRTHTSPVQVRAMQKYGAPLRCIVPGRCFRSEATDVRHEHTFYQLEGLMIDENISIANLKGVLEVVARYLFGQGTKVRLRPKFYPFVEPGFNGEVTCFLCQGKGCRLCKNTGWLELLGAGMVHPNVLKAGGIDAKAHRGFAFGFGLNRIVQLKYDIGDVRLFNSGDLRFLEQF